MVRSKTLSVLSRCSIDKGHLIVTGLTINDTKQLAKELRNAIIDYRIPFYKPVAIYIPKANSVSDVLSTIPGINGCYADMFTLVDNLCLADCEDYTSSLISTIRKDNKENKNIEYGIVINDDKGLVTTGCDWKIAGSVSYAKTLSKDEIIMTTTGKDIVEVYLLMERNNGHLSYDHSSYLLGKVNSKTFIPLSTTYSLEKYITMDMVNIKEGVIRFMYKHLIDESVLERILRRFGKEVGEGLWE